MQSRYVYCVKLTFESLGELQAEENIAEFALTVGVHGVIGALQHDVVPLDVFLALGARTDMQSVMSSPSVDRRNSMLAALQDLLIDRRHYCKLSVRNHG